MMEKKKVTKAVGCGVALVVFAFLFFRSCIGMPGSRVADEEVFSRGDWQIRIQQRLSTAAPLPGAYYDFASWAPGATEWHELFVLLHDDPVPLPRENVHFLGDSVAWVYMGWHYAVSTDAGRSWSTWNAFEDFAGWQGPNYRLIESVELEANGRGEMHCNPIPGRGAVPVLYTKDFGRSWHRTPP